MTFVLGHHVPLLVYSFIMLFHGVSHARRVNASLYGAVVRRSFVVGLHVLTQIMLILEAALTEVTGERPLVTMAEFDVDLQGGEGCTRHVT